jgi:hypothetical protein
MSRDKVPSAQNFWTNLMTPKNVFQITEQALFRGESHNAVFLTCTFTITRANSTLFQTKNNPFKPPCVVKANNLTYTNNDEAGALSFVTPTPPTFLPP